MSVLLLLSLIIPSPLASNHQFENPDYNVAGFTLKDRVTRFKHFNPSKYYMTMGAKLDRVFWEFGKQGFPFIKDKEFLFKAKARRQPLCLPACLPAGRSTIARTLNSSLSFGTSIDYHRWRSTGRASRPPRTRGSWSASGSGRTRRPTPRWWTSRRRRRCVMSVSVCYAWVDPAFRGNLTLLQIQSVISTAGAHHELQ